MLTSRSNQARTPGNVRAPRVGTRDNRTDPRVVHERRSKDCNNPDITKYLGRSICREGVKPRGRDVNGVVREARVGVSVFLIDVTEDLDGRSFIVPKVNEENDLLDSVPGDSLQVKLAAIDALLVGANISVKLAGAERDPGTIRSKKVKDLFVVRYGNKEIETLDSDELDKIVTPFGQKGPVEKITEELEGDRFRVKWRKQVEEEVVSIEDLADSVVWGYRLAQQTPSTSHPHDPDLRKGYKKHKEALLVHRPEPKHSTRLVDDAKEQGTHKKRGHRGRTHRRRRGAVGNQVGATVPIHSRTLAHSLASLSHSLALLSHALTRAYYSLIGSLVLSFSIPYY